MALVSNPPQTGEGRLLSLDILEYIQILSNAGFSSILRNLLFQTAVCLFDWKGRLLSVDILKQIQILSNAGLNSILRNLLFQTAVCLFDWKQCLIFFENNRALFE